MKKIIYLIVFLIASNNCFSQYVVYEDQGIADVYSWLKEGNYQFEILDKDIPADLRKIIERYRAAAGKNKAWYLKYREQYANKSPLPYHENFGITAAEYNRMNKEYPVLKMKMVATKDIIVKKQDDILRFEGKDDFKILDIIEISKEYNKVTLDSLPAKFIGQVYEDTSVYGGGYSGYKWKYEEGNYEAVKHNQASDYLLFEVTFAKTTQGGRLLLIMDVMKVQNLNIIVDSKISGYLKPVE